MPLLMTLISDQQRAAFLTGAHHEISHDQRSSILDRMRLP
jgi:hypothetical protein